MTADASEHGSITTQLHTMLDGIATAALVFAAKPEWRPLKVYQAKGHERIGAALQKAFGLSGADVVTFPGSPPKFADGGLAYPAFSIDQAMDGLFLSRSDF